MAAAYLLAPDIEVKQRCIKIAWDSRQHALRVMRGMGKASGVTQTGEGKLEVFKCGWCKKYHLGHARIRR